MVTLQDWQQAHTGRVKALNLQTEEARTLYWKRIEAQRSGFIGRFSERFHQLLQTLQRRVVSAAGNTTITAQIPEAVENALKGHEEEYRTQIEALYRSVWPAFAQQVVEEIVGSGESDYTDFIQKRNDSFERAKQGEDEDFWQRQAQGFVSNHGGVLIQEPTGVTRDRIIAATRTAVQEGLQEGVGSEEIARRIDNSTSNVVSRVRARRIARTETIRASNRASLSGAQRTASQIGDDLLKEWIPTMDSRVRREHAAMQGATRPLNSDFSVGGFPASYPSDPRLPARLSIHCRCTLAYQTK